MAGVASNIGTIALAVQTGKGTYASTPTVKFNLAAMGVYPVRELGQYSQTGAGRDQGSRFTSAMRVEGDFQVYVSPGTVGGLSLLAKLALGSNADSGSTNFTHIATPSTSLPYCTIWRMVGAQIFEKFVDCKINTLGFNSAAGSPLMVTVGVVGITSQFEAADTALAAVSTDGLLHMEAQGRFKHATVAQPLAEFNLEYNNNVTPYQADDYLSYDVNEGLIDCTGSFRCLYTGPTAFPKYRDFFYGSPTGTQLQVTSTAGQEAFEAQWYRGTNNYFKINIPQIRYESVPVTADPAGDAIEVDVSFAVDKVSGQALVTTTSADQTATA